MKKNSVKFKLVFLSASLFFLSLSLAFAATQCQLAYPMMEVIKCDKGESFTTPESFSCSGSLCSLSHTCISDCIIDLTLRCDGGSFDKVRGVAKINGVNPRSLDDLTSTSLNAGEGDYVYVEAYCKSWFTGAVGQLTAGSVASIKDYNKYLYATNHDWSGHKLGNTQNCIPQDRVYQFLDDQVQSGNLPSVYTRGGQDALGNDAKALIVSLVNSGTLI